jgi:hypothetical protein
VQLVLLLHLFSQYLHIRLRFHPRCFGLRCLHPGSFLGSCEGDSFIGLVVLVLGLKLGLKLGLVVLLMVLLVLVQLLVVLLLVRVLLLNAAKATAAKAAAATVIDSHQTVSACSSSPHLPYCILGSRWRCCRWRGVCFAHTTQLTMCARVWVMLSFHFLCWRWR